VESKSYAEVNPITSLFFVIVTGGLGLLFLPFMTQEVEIEGCEYKVGKNNLL
jgi:hypothetical protein